MLHEHVFAPFAVFVASLLTLRPRRFARRSRTDTPPHVNSAIMHNFYTNFLSVRTLPVPVVAAVNGAAIGAGACVTLAADYRVAKPSAVIGFNFAKLGIHPGMGGSHYLPRLIGHGPASRVLLSGATYSGDEAKV